MAAEGNIRNYYGIFLDGSFKETKQVVKYPTSYTYTDYLEYASSGRWVFLNHQVMQSQNSTVSSVTSGGSPGDTTVVSFSRLTFPLSGEAYGSYVNLFYRSPYSYSITYDANGGSNAPSATTFSEATAAQTPQRITLTSSVPTYTGKVFLGWSDSSSATSATYQSGGTKSCENQNYTLYAVWQTATYSVSYNANGGSGAPSQQTGITYGSNNWTCSGTVPTHPTIGYVFRGWSESSTASSPTYYGNTTYTIYRSMTLYAVWEYVTYTLTTSVNNSTYGSVSPSGSSSRAYGSTVSISATPNGRIAVFTGWSGSASGTTNPLSVTMDADKSVTANFAATKGWGYTYGVQNSANMGGWVSLNGGSQVSSSYTVSNVAYGTSLAFTTGCSSGYRFKRWQLTYRTVSASGSVGSVDYTVYPSGWGSEVTWSSGPVNVSGTTVTGSATGAYVITKIMAEFEPIPYVIYTAVAKTASSYGRWDASETPGSVTGGGTYDYGTQHQLSASAASSGNYSFSRWNDSVTTNPRTVTVSGNATYTAYFTGKPCTITLTQSSHGTIAFSDGGGTSREYGTYAKLTATPAAHYAFARWSDGSTDRVRSVAVSGNASFQAVFTVNDTVTISTSVSPAGYGTVSGGGTKTYDSTVTLTATPADSTKEFVNWSDGETANPRSFTADESSASVTYTANFRLKTYALSVAGTNCTVSKNPNASTYAYGTQVTLSVTPNAHYHFTQWTDGNTSNPRTVTVTGSASYSAQAAIDYHSITTSASPSSYGNVTQTLVSGTAGTGNTYAYGSVVELSASPADANRQFDDWSDGVTSSTRRVTVGDSDVSYVARFSLKQYTVSVSSGGGGSTEIVGKSGSSANFDYGATATLKATPSSHYSFLKWTKGSDEWTTNPLGVTVTGNATYVATFAVDTYQVSVSASGNGTVTGGGTYGYGTQATLVATPDAHNDFLGWYDSGDTKVSGEMTYRPTVTGAASYVAKFAVHRHAVSVTHVGSGSTTAGGSFEYGSSQVFSATADAHNHFVKWTKNGSDYAVTASITVTVTADAEYCAVFAVDMHTVTTGVVTPGTGSVTSGGSYAYGSTFQATATPASNYHFRKWYLNGTATDITNALLEVTVTGDAAYTAEFTIGVHQITASVTPADCGGSVTGTGSYDEGETATLTAVKGVGSHYHFNRWSDGVTTSSRQVVVSGPASFTAEYILDTHTLTVSSSDTTKGTVTGGGTKAYTETADYLITAVPAAHCHFVGWRRGSSQEIISTDTSMYVPLTANTAYTGVFASDTHVITVYAVGMGTATGGGTYDYGSVHTISAQAEEGYSFSQWNDGSKTNPRSVTVTGNATYVATFEKRATDKGRVFSARHAALFW